MSALDVGARGLAQRAIEIQRLPDRAAFQRALVSAADGDALYLAERGREGRFVVWSAAPFEASYGYPIATAVAMDPQQGIYVATDDQSKVAVRPVNGDLILASWFGWARNDNGGTGAGNKIALQAVENLIGYDVDGGWRPFASSTNNGGVVDLGWGEYDFGEPDDTVGFTRIYGNYVGHGFVQTQINWKGAADATVIRWHATRGFFKNCRLGGAASSADNRPKVWIDTSYDAGIGGSRLIDWSDNFDNFYTDVSDHPDAAAIVLYRVGNFSMNQVRFQGGTRHIKVIQDATSSQQRGLHIRNYTFDFSNGGAGVFREHILVDITGNGQLQITLAPTRTESRTLPQANAAIVRVTDTQGPNNIGANAVSLTIEGGAGWQWPAASAAWFVYHDTPQIGCFTQIHLPHGGLFEGFQGAQGGNWSATWNVWTPPFVAAGTLFAPWTNDQRQDNYLGPSARVSGTLTFGAAAGVLTSYPGSPEGHVTAPVGSISLNAGGTPLFANYRKKSGSGSTGWFNNSRVKGTFAGTTDANGDLLVSHGGGGTPGMVFAQADGAVLWHVRPTAIGSSTFKLRVFDAAGEAVVSTSVSGWWIMEAAP